MAITWKTVAKTLYFILPVIFILGIFAIHNSNETTNYFLPYNIKNSSDVLTIIVCNITYFPTTITVPSTNVNSPNTSPTSLSTTIINTCRSPPTTATWIIISSCTLTTSTIVSGNVTVPSGVTLT